MNIRYLFFIVTLLLPLQDSLGIKSETIETEVLSKVFDRTTGSIYLGLESGAAEKAISVGKRFNGVNTTAPLLRGIALNDLVNDQSIEFLALATKPCNKDPLLAIVIKNEGGEWEQKKVIVMTKNGQKISELACNLLDASGNQDEDGAETAGIINIAANNNYIFAAVRPHEGDFGDDNGGLAVVKIDRRYLGFTDNNNQKTLEQTTAQNDSVDGPDTGIKSKKIDETTEELQINNNPTIEATNKVALHWDEKLQRLYIGINQITSGGDVDDGAKSVIVAQIHEKDENGNKTGSVTFYDIADNGAFTNGATDEIVGVISTNQALTAHNLRTMHTSTGRDYLIINGGNGDIDETGNEIYALPLYYNPTEEDKHGTLATRDFTAPVNAPGELTTNDDTLDPQAFVGRNTIPINADEHISDIVVIGDTVYVSLNLEQDDENETGILYSQAVFDENGIITGWTQWTRRAFPFAPLEELQRQQDTEETPPFESLESKGQVKFFAIDASNGKVWAIEGSTETIIGVTKWERSGKKTVDLCPREETIISLVKRLNEDLPEGSFSVLDLDATTNGFVDAIGRYALFGGLNKVVFAKISDILGERVQTVIEDFSRPENYLKTTLPNSGCVTHLEYSRRTEENENYFFAGTPHGLYVYANNNGEGFSIDGVDNLNNAPFTERSWKKIEKLSAPIIDIKTSGDQLYVLTLQTSKNLPIINVLYSIDFADNIDDMFDDDHMRIIAKSGTLAPDSDLKKAKIFTAIGIFTANYEEGQEELVIATNNGIYRSHTVGEGIGNAVNQEDAHWAPINPIDSYMYNNIFHIGGSIELTSMPTTIWPIRVVDQKNCKSYSKNNVTQLNWKGYIEEEEEEETEPKFVPPHFNAKKFGDDTFDNHFKTFDPIHYFWSDGARRFFIIQRASDCFPKTTLHVIPYDIEEWCIKNPTTQMLADPILKSVKQFYWVRQIGISGLLMAGVDNGVVSLQ